MDPNATLARIDQLLRAVETLSHAGEDSDSVGDELDATCKDLWDWIQKGGFEPEWDKYPTAAGYYACRAVYHKREGLKA